VNVDIDCPVGRAEEVAHGSLAQLPLAEPASGQYQAMILPW
jgi:hypothetical protein